MSTTSSDGSFISIPGVLIGMLFTLGVTLFLGAAAFSTWSDERAYNHHGQTTNARVVELSYKVVGAGEDQETVFLVAYEVARQAGRPERIEQSIPRELHETLRQGSSIPVEYVPERPELIRIDHDFLDSGLDIVIPLAVGASFFGFAFIGLLMLLVSAVKRRQTAA